MLLNSFGIGHIHTVTSSVQRGMMTLFSVIFLILLINTSAQNRSENTDIPRTGFYATEVNSNRTPAITLSSSVDTVHTPTPSTEPGGDSPSSLFNGSNLIALLVISFVALLIIILCACTCIRCACCSYPSAKYERFPV